MDSNVPAQLRAGDTWEWTRDLPDYPAPTWVLTYYLVNECDAPAGLVAVASGTQHAVTVSAVDSAQIAPGRYRWYAKAVSGAAAKTAEEGWVEVLPDASTQEKFDARTTPEVLLAAVEATLLGRAKSDQLAMSINGRSISRIPLSELAQWRDSLRTEIKAQEAAETAGAGRDIKVRIRRG